MNRPTLDDIVPQRPIDQPDWMGGAGRKRNRARAVRAVATVAALAIGVTGIGLTVQALSQGPDAVPAAPTTPNAPAPSANPCAEPDSTVAMDVSEITSVIACGTDSADGSPVTVDLPESLVTILRENLVADVEARDPVPDLKATALNAPSLRVTTPDGSYTLQASFVFGDARGYTWHTENGPRFWYPTTDFQEQFGPLVKDMQVWSGDLALDSCTADFDGYNLYEPTSIDHVAVCRFVDGALKAELMPKAQGEELVTTMKAHAKSTDSVPEVTDIYLAPIDTAGTAGRIWVTSDGNLAEVWPDASADIWTPTGSVLQSLRDLDIVK